MYFVFLALVQDWPSLEHAVKCLSATVCDTLYHFDRNTAPQMVFELTVQLFADWLFQEVLEMENYEDQVIFTCKEHIYIIIIYYIKEWWPTLFIMLLSL